MKPRLAYAAGVRDISDVRGLRGAIVRAAQWLIARLLRNTDTPIMMVAELPDIAPLPIMDVEVTRMAMITAEPERPVAEANAFALSHYALKRSVKYMFRRGRRFAGDIK